MITLSSFLLTPAAAHVTHENGRDVTVKHREKKKSERDFPHAWSEVNIHSRVRDCPRHKKSARSWHWINIYESTLRDENRREKTRWKNVYDDDWLGSPHSWPDHRHHRLKFNKVSSSVTPRNAIGMLLLSRVRPAQREPDAVNASSLRRKLRRKTFYSSFMVPKRSGESAPWNRRHEAPARVLCVMTFLTMFIVLASHFPSFFSLFYQPRKFRFWRPSTAESYGK